MIASNEYVYAPTVDIELRGQHFIKGSFIGTKTHLYLVPHESAAKSTSLKDFFIDGLSNTIRLERFSVGDKKLHEIMPEILQDPEMDLAGLDTFMIEMKNKWDAIKRVEIASLGKLKVTSNFFGGSISYKNKGDILYSHFIMSIPGSHRKLVKAFYKEIA
jgi:hypothetical protein